MGLSSIWSGAARRVVQRGRPRPALNLPAMTTLIDDSSTDRLPGLLTEAAERASRLGRRVLVSVAEQVPMLDPLAVLDASRRTGRAGTEALGFWSHPADGVAIAALGSEFVIEAAGEDRFGAVDAAVRQLLDDALVDDPSGGVDGVGPALMGGFAFEPAGPTAEPWRDFGSARLTLPRMLITTAGSTSWVTTNVLVGPDGAPDDAAAGLAELRDAAPNSGPLAREEGARAMDVADTRDAGEWQGLVAHALRVIRTGALAKVVVARSRHATAAVDIDTIAALAHLRARYPDCYVFGWWSGASAFIGASPERLVRLDGRRVRASSLAGSAARGATRAADAASAAMLVASAKDRAEHAMVRDALLAGLGTLCDDVAAPAQPSLFTLPHVHHLHTAVRARLRAGHSLLDLVRVLHPTPAVGGTPRDSALEFLREHERLDRGWYAAPVGWIGRDRGEFAVALRSALVRGREAWLFAGCGIVAGSDPAMELAETLLKFRPMEQALTAAMDGDPA